MRVMVARGCIRIVTGACGRIDGEPAGLVGTASGVFVAGGHVFQQVTS
jgi:hypothetical protein